MSQSNQTRDRNGKIVTIGCRVRITQLLPQTLSVIPPRDLPEVISMVGCTFEVDDIDVSGQAWVSKEIERLEDQTFGHMLGLAPEEIERLDTEIPIDPGYG